MTCISRAFLMLVTAACVFGADSTMAQDYPSRPIRFIVPNTPGSSTDFPARIISPAMSKLLGQPIIVENKPGAAQLLGYEYVAKQVPADGYTIAVVTVPALVTLPLTVKNLRFDPLKDLRPIIGLVEQRFLLASSSQESWNTFREMVGYAKANPGKLGAPVVTRD